MNMQYFCALLGVLFISGCASSDVAQQLSKLVSQSSPSGSRLSYQDRTFSAGDELSLSQKPKVIIPMGVEYSDCPGIARLLNIEVFDGGFVRFNFMLNGTWQCTLVPPYQEISLDMPIESTTFIVDQLGRQYPLVQASGISPEQSVEVANRSSRNFSLVFRLDSDVKSFKYQMILHALRPDVFISGKYEESRIRIEASKAISLPVRY